MTLEWSENGEWCQRLGKRGALVWSARIRRNYIDDDGRFRRDEPPWEIQYDSRWSRVMGVIPLGTVDRALAKRMLRSWAEDFDRNEIDALLARDAAKRNRRKQ